MQCGILGWILELKGHICRKVAKIQMKSRVLCSMIPAVSCFDSCTMVCELEASEEAEGRAHMALRPFL